MALASERSWDQFYEVGGGRGGALGGLEGANYVASFRARTSGC